jgi:hypothetical protein
MTEKIDQENRIDYENFLKFENTVVPEQVKNQTHEKILNLLNPNGFMVFFKILGIHAFVGFLSLSVCHQFDMNPFNTERSISDWFMQVGGHQLCMFGCGVLFTSVSLLAAGYFLTQEEVGTLKQSEFFQTMALAMISIGFFIAFGVELSLAITGIWLLGGLIGGMVSTEIVWKLKNN